MQVGFLSNFFNFMEIQSSTQESGKIAPIELKEGTDKFASTFWHTEVRQGGVINIT